ncbi:unannotated protein [freshwater metagenome]|uniref:Unannotated protein n=1 Tax=freshwater metagenome TaxID=449393 RepID=A0A6J7RIU6_9ZZZZ
MTLAEMAVKITGLVETVGIFFTRTKFESFNL